ncbi:DNA repair protein RecO (recombination protein O) [Desulfobaculum xiamenense]|uniref:DNA repair protein RecO n=1 Tax=Desulfobaculum xiamenense TaxID=995050 RepID=A0A846QKP9_9BACT|nr:DNA repair protein RecO (recombination protein O) [Desulfobaculum xiamenense]
MQDFTEKAIILRVGRFREADLWLRLFTPHRGLLTAFAFGGSRSRRRFVGCLDPLNLVLFGFSRSRTGNYLSLTEGTLLDGRPGLRGNASRLGIAANCVKFFEAVHVEPEGSVRSFNLLEESLEAVERCPDLSPMFPVFFRLRTAFEQGYGPSLDTCSRCGKVLKTSVAPLLLIEEGRISCEACATEHGWRIPLNAGSLAVLDRVRRESPRQWCSLVPDAADRRRLFDVADGFMRWHLGLRWEDGRFLKT